MNWLAHLVLSEPFAPFRIGNLLPDIARPAQLVRLPPEFQRGIEQHRRIDAFTDTHPLVRQSILRVEAPFRRYAGVLVDIFFDHVLSREWTQHCPAERQGFIAEFYACLDAYQGVIPLEAFARLQQIREADLLGSYYEVSGVTEALRRVGRRFRQPVPLENCARILEERYDDFAADFREFFPALRSHLAGR